jgi:hypothetical protein
MCKDRWRMGEGHTSARSRSLYFVEEDEDGGEMREVTYEERERKITILVFRKKTGHSPKSLKMFIISLFWTGRDSKAVTSSVKLRRCYTCLLIPVCHSPIGAIQADNGRLPPTVKLYK